MTTLRGRPRSDILMSAVLEAVYRHHWVTAAARELGCSPAYVHARLKEAGLTLWDVLEAERVEDLLHGRQ